MGAVINSRITNCYATCSVSGIGEGFLASRIGGIAGEITGSIGNVGIATNCYATGAVSGNNEVGGIAGCIPSSGSITNCAALNISITRTGGSSTTQFGRVAGCLYENPTLTNNVAYSGMTVLGNTVTTGTATNINGADMDKATIQAGGTLGNRFTAANGWTVENGKLPGFGAAVELPEHLQ